METQTMEVAALGRPLHPGMLYDCRSHSFIPGVTLWNKTSVSKDLYIRTQQQTDLKLSSSDSLLSKTRLMDISASLKASFMGGLVEVGGSAKYLRDTKSTNQVSRVTMFYSETTRFKQLTMNQLGKFTYPQVFDQKTATHVVTAALYGAQAFMVFDWVHLEDEDKQVIEGQLNVMIKKIPEFSIEGEGAVKMQDDDKKRAENISCTFHGDFHLDQNPTTYMEALQVYKQLPNRLKKNPKNVIPIKVWLYPLHLLNKNAAQMVREISTTLVSKTEAVMEDLGEVERRCSDLFSNKLVNVFSDIKERLRSFQSSFSIYKLLFQKALCRVLPSIQGGGKEEQLLENILETHNNSPFNARKLNQWLDDQKFELGLLRSYTKSLDGIRIEASDGLNFILIDPDISKVICLALTSLKYEDQYLSDLNTFLKSEAFEKQHVKEEMTSVVSYSKWFHNKDVITSMRRTLSAFKKMYGEEKSDKVRFIISAISDSEIKGSSIYQYENGTLTSTKNKEDMSTSTKQEQTLTNQPFDI